MGQTKKIRKRLLVQAEPDCHHCGGTGLKVSNEYSAYARKLEVTIEVCPCVRVVATPQLSVAVKAAV